MKFNFNIFFWFSGLISTFIGNGIGRFAYTALIPLLIKDSWVSSFESTQLGVATFIGYLIGPIFINSTKNYIHSVSLIKFGLLVCSLGYIMFIFHDLGFYWMYFWRFLIGFGGALLMVLSPTVILPYYKKSEHKGLISGLIFSGIGIGISFSGLLIPFLYEKVNLSNVFLFSD